MAQRHGLGHARVGDARPAAQVGRQRGTQEGGVGQAAAQLLGDDGHLDGRRQGCTAGHGGAQLPPA